jgi:hypothetical protein
MQQRNILWRAYGLDAHLHQFSLAVAEEVLKLLIRCEEAQTGDVNDVGRDRNGCHGLHEVTLVHERHVPRPFLNAAELEGDVLCHKMNGGLVRSLSLSPDRGILEDIGDRFLFEGPFWSGQHPATEDEDDSYPLPFHPLEMGEVVLKEFFGYQLEGFIHSLPPLQPESIPLLKYKRRSRWKFW